MEILNEEREDEGAYFIMENDKRVAELIYRKVGEDRIVISQTGVSKSQKGEGLGRKMIDKLVERARMEKLKLIPVCSYARHVFDKEDSLKDLL